MKIILNSVLVICGVFMMTSPAHAYNDGWAI